MGAAAFRFCEESGRVAVRVHEEIAVIDADAPVRRLGAAEQLDASADVLGYEHLRSHRVDVVAKHLGRYAWRQRDGADAARYVNGRALASGAAGKKDDVSGITPYRRHLVVDQLRVPEIHVLRPANAPRELTFNRHRAVQVVSQTSAGG